jgi:small-conductance mechanosensitive channel
MKHIFTKFIKAETLVSRYLALFLVFCSIIAAKLGYLEGLKALLNSDTLTITFGSVKLTAYNFLIDSAIVIGVFFVAGMSSSYLENRVKNLRHFKPAHRTLITKFTQIFIYFIFGVFALHMIGIDITALAVVSGAIGIGIGLGLQKIIANLTSSFILLFEQYVSEGDFIETNNGILGRVAKIGTRAVLLRTADGKEVIVPSEDFITNVVTNWTLSSKQIRIELMVPVAYDSDIMKAYEIVMNAAINHPMVMQNPEPQCFLKDFLDGAVNLRLVFWVEDILESHSKPKSDLQFEIWQEFKKHKIYFAYPDMDMYKERAK